MLKIKGITARENKAIAEYKRLLLSKFSNRLKKLLLFGSKSRGTSNRNSDIDILVVVAKDGKRIAQEIAILTHEPIAKYMVDISPITVEEDFFKNWSPLLEHIRKDGIVIWTNKKAKKNM